MEYLVYYCVFLGLVSLALLGLLLHERAARAKEAAEANDLAKRLVVRERDHSWCEEKLAMEINNREVELRATRLRAIEHISALIRIIQRVGGGGEGAGTICRLYGNFQEAWLMGIGNGMHGGVWASDLGRLIVRTLASQTDGLGGAMANWRQMLSGAAVHLTYLVNDGALHTISVNRDVEPALGARWLLHQAHAGKNPLGVDDAELQEINAYLLRLAQAEREAKKEVTAASE